MRRPAAAPGAVHLPFRDRREAGELLAARLGEMHLPADTVVLAIPRGGVPVAAAVARRLGLTLDVIAAHKIGAPFNPEFAIGAVTGDGTVLEEAWAGETADEAYLARATEREIARTRERETRLRRGRAAFPIAGRDVVVIDDGIATGATVHVAVLAARAQGARRVIVASPVAAPESAARLGAIADDVVVLAAPPSFLALSQWYVRFDQLDDEDVAAELDAAARPGG